MGAPTRHLETFRTLWKNTPLEEWPHHFMHTLEGIPVSRYIDQKLHRGTTSWTVLQQNFRVTLSFGHENPNIDETIKQIRGVIFIKESEVESITKEQQKNRQIMRELLSCYHVQEEAPNEEDSCDIHIEEVEGKKEVDVPPLES
jgi:hypothetical protein